MRALISFLAFVALLSCRNGGSSSPRPEAGLLLGLSSGRTLIIAAESGHAALVAERKPLLVPKGNTFYWVGTVTRCYVDTSSSDFVPEQEWVAQNEEVYVVRAGDTARVEMRGADCSTVEPRILPLRAVRDSVLRKTRAELGEDRRPALKVDNNGELYCNVESRTITYASDSVLAYQARGRTTEYCSPARYATDGRNVVRHLSDENRVSLRSVVPASEWAKVQKTGQDTSDDNCAFGEDREEGAIDTAWAITRENGRWIASIWQNGPTVCRGGRESVLTDVSIDALTGVLRLPLAWDSLQRQVPKTLDAASSPSGKLLLLHRPDSLTIVPFVAGRVGPALIQLPAKYEEQFVELRWLDADEMAKLRSTLASLRDPVVVVTPPTVR